VTPGPRDPLEIVTKKRCVRCGLTKWAGAFGPNKEQPDGLATWCWGCDKRHRPQHAAVPEWAMLPVRDTPDKCGTCHQRIDNGSDGMGFATVTCGCGTRYVVRRLATNADPPTQERSLADAVFQGTLYTDAQGRVHRARR
jgi:hypothetical protein